MPHWPASTLRRGCPRCGSPWCGGNSGGRSRFACWRRPRPRPWQSTRPSSGRCESVAQAGCRDNFGFVPLQVGADVPLEANGPTAIPIISLPSAAEMVGNPAARIAYASLIVYQDGNGNGILDLGHPADQQQRGQGNGNPNDASNSPDTVYGASFISMTQPDQRVAYREGDFNPGVAYYPRAGCASPPPSFSILSAGGFSVSDGLLSEVTGQFPPETSCGTAPISEPVTVALQDPATLAELACMVNNASGVTYYRKPPADDPRTVGSAGSAAISAPWACTNLPSLSGDDGGVPPGRQLVVAGPPGQRCLGTLHYTLRGCNNNPSCPSPATWDVSGSPPSGGPRRAWKRHELTPWPGPPRARARPDGAGVRGVAPGCARQRGRGFPPVRATRRSPRRVAQGHAGLRRGRSPALFLAHRERPRPVEKARLPLRPGPRLRPSLRHQRASQGSLIGPVVRGGVRLDESWSIMSTLSYQYAMGTGTVMQGLRYAGTIEPTWHATEHLALAVGLGFGGIVEPRPRGPIPTPSPAPSRRRTPSPMPSIPCPAAAG